MNTAQEACRNYIKGTAWVYPSGAIFASPPIHSFIFQTASLWHCKFVLRCIMSICRICYITSRVLLHKQKGHTMPNNTPWEKWLAVVRGPLLYSILYTSKSQDTSTTWGSSTYKIAKQKYVHRWKETPCTDNKKNEEMKSFYLKDKCHHGQQTRATFSDRIFLTSNPG